MSKSEPTKEDYDSLIYKLATLESELGQARKLLEAPAKRSLWRRIWGGRGKAIVAGVLLAVVLVGVAGGAGEFKVFGVYDWQKLSEGEKLLYGLGYNDGMAAGSALQEVNPKLMDILVKCTNKWTAGQGVAVLEKYIKDNPHKWDRGIAILFFEALKDACEKR